MAAPIYNPIIPCVHPIPGGMYPGRMIRVQGNVPPGGQRFAINFQCGPNTDPRDDIALHLNFRFVEMCVVRNHLTAMNWGVEETSGGMPLARGEGFEALILCEPQSIKVALNGVHFCEFLHRVPFQRISHLTIDGDVHVQFVGFEGTPPPQQIYMAEPPAYGSYGAPPPSYGAPGYGAPQGYTAVASPGAYQTSYAPQQRSGMGTGAAVGLGVGALAAGGLAGYALGGGFSSDSQPSEGFVNTGEDYLQTPDEPAAVENDTATDEAERPEDTGDDDDDYLVNDAEAADENVDKCDLPESSLVDESTAGSPIVGEVNTEGAAVNAEENAAPSPTEGDKEEADHERSHTEEPDTDDTEVNEEENELPLGVEDEKEDSVKDELPINDDAAYAEVNEEENEVESHVDDQADEVLHEEDNEIPPYEDDASPTGNDEDDA